MTIEIILPLATKYVADLLLKNEEIKKFPKEFITEGAKWVRSWFLKDDPTVQAVVESGKPTIEKEVALETKLSELLKNPQFVEEMKTQLAVYSQHNPTAKNIIEASNLDITGSVYVGDKQGNDATVYDQKNVVKAGTIIKSGGDFRLGDG